MKFEKILSISSPEVYHERPECYLSELVLLNKHGTLPDRFWNMDKYKKSYVSCLQLIKKRLDFCDYKYIYSAIINNKVVKLDASFDLLILKEIENEN